MSSIASYIDDNAQTIRLLKPDGDAKWSPGKDIGDDDAFAHRNRLSSAADWIVASLSQKKRLDLVCLGVSDALCRWMTAPSTEPNVVAAVARGKGEEWGSVAAIGTTEPLTAPHRKSHQRTTAVHGAESHFPAISIHDASYRVLLDELDTRGIRVGSVLTIWHAMCRAWDESLPTERAMEDLGKGSDNGNTQTAASSPITAILITTEDNAVVWAWSKGRRLLTGGRNFVAHNNTSDSIETVGPSIPDYSSACGRIALDWLTWSAQLGQSPERLIIVSPDANEIAKQCARLWPTAKQRQIPEIDPIAATLNQLITADPIKPESDARTCVASLTNRPSKAHRRLNQWAGVLLLAIALTIAGLGWQFRKQSSVYNEQEQAIATNIAAKLTPIDQRMARDPRPKRALENKINELAAGSEGFVEPGLPLPILSELLRVGAALKDTENVKIERLEITETRSVLRLSIPDTVTGEQIIENLRTSTGSIRWIESNTGIQTGRLVLNGAWTLESDRL